MAVFRQFIDWKLPLLPTAAEYLISRYAVGQQLDLSRVFVVVESMRASQRLLEILVQKAQSQWPALIPPRFVTASQFPELLYQQKRQLADDFTQLLVWRKALTSVTPADLKDALPHLPDDESVPAWMALCETLRRQHNELASESMDFGDLHRSLKSLGHLQESSRWKALLKVQQSYLKHMDSLDLWDRQAARLYAVRNEECRIDGEVVLVGTMDLDKIVRQMLVQVADRVTVLIQAPENEEESFDDYGCLKPEAWVNRLLDLPFESVRIADDPLDQGRAVVSELAALGTSVRPDEVTIGVASDDLAPVLQQALADSGVHGRWEGGLPLSHSRPWRLLEAVSLHLNSSRDGLPGDFDSMATLVRHPDLSDWITIRLNQKSERFTGTDWITQLDLYLADHLQTVPGAMLGEPTRRSVVSETVAILHEWFSVLLPGNRGTGAIESDSAEKSVRPEGPATAARKTPKRGQKSADQTKRDDRQKKLLFDLDDSQQPPSLFSGLSRRRPLSEWIAGTVRLLSVIYHGRAIRPESLADRALQHCITAALDISDLVQRMPTAVMPNCTAGQAIQLLMKQIGSRTVPADDDPSAVDLVRWSGLLFDDAPCLILAGFNEGNIPESSLSDLFLPNSFRTTLGLADNTRRLARDLYALTAIRHCRRKVVLVAGRRNSDGNPLTPSRLWFAADAKSLPERVRRFYQPASIESSADDSAQILTSDSPEAGSGSGAGSSRLSGFMVPVPQLVRKRKSPLEISVTAFREYINCPYRYFLNRELRLQSVAERDRELDGAVFGNLIHDVLKSFGESDLRSSESADAIRKFLFHELEVLAIRQFGSNRSATIAVQLKMAEDRLSQFAEWQADTTREGWRIFRTELNGRVDKMRDSKDRAFSLVGRIDRIDQWKEQDCYRVLDYKTSDSPQDPQKSHRHGEDWIDFQLPLYRTLVREIGLSGELQLGYIHLPGDLTRVGPAMANWTDGELDDAENRAREIAAEIIDLRIDRVDAGDAAMPSDYSRICQETVIDRNIPWLPWSLADSQRVTKK